MSIWIRSFAAFVILLVAAQLAHARDPDGRYAKSPLHAWFEQLESKKGRCCSDADGRALSDVDWTSHDGHYRVQIDGEWVDVPDDALITEPNRAGPTMVWPTWAQRPSAGALLSARQHGVSKRLRVSIRCFYP